MQFPAIDPVAFSIGSLQLRWYGLMYLLAFFVGWPAGGPPAPVPAGRPWMWTTC